MRQPHRLLSLLTIVLLPALLASCASKQKSYKDWEPPPLGANPTDSDDEAEEEVEVRESSRDDDRDRRRQKKAVKRKSDERAIPDVELPPQANAQAQLVAVGDEVKNDAEMTALLAPFKKTVDKRVLRVVGYLTAPLERGRGESTLGNFVSDAMREGIALEIGEKTDLCFTNSGGLRRDVPAGKVTEGTLTELMPFDNAIVVFTLRGTALKSVLKRMNRRGDPGSGVREREGRFMVDGSPLDPDRTYTICTNDYVFEGGGKYNFKSAKDVRYTGVLLRDVIISSFEREHKAGRKVTPKLDGRSRQAPR